MYYIRYRYGSLSEVKYDHVGPFTLATEAASHMQEYGPGGSDIVHIYATPEPLMSVEEHITYVLNRD